jgi:peptidyl-prolyl cis-trans isomerase B (cyclophilin B)
MAILALIFAFIFAPLGIVFGWIGLSQLKRVPQDGRGLAIAGIAVGAVFTVLIVLYIILIAVLFAKVSHDFPDPNSTATSFAAARMWLGGLAG